MTDLSVYSNFSLEQRCLVFDSEIQIPTFSDFDLAPFFPLYGKDLDLMRSYEVSQIMYFINQVKTLNTDQGFSVKKFGIDERFEELANKVIGWGHGAKEETLTGTLFLAVLFNIVDEFKKENEHKISLNVFCVDFSDVCAIPFGHSKSCKLLVLFTFNHFHKTFRIMACEACLLPVLVKTKQVETYLYSL